MMVTLLYEEGSGSDGNLTNLDSAQKCVYFVEKAQ
tara:strand:+ start:422 stop:526 length:105 start_codon:yes stop_codon:yes gene_type:complete